MKKLLLVAIMLLGIASCTPIRYVYVDPKDSTIRKQRVIYDNLYIPSPFYFNYGWGSPYYNPIIIQAPLNGYLKKPIIQPNKLNIPLPPRPPRGKR